ncbi:MAG: FMN-binding protein [Firmicutes bacterium]|jgi:electron transport complex protein RnfG|nr:FMN-binding protein [Bacillota bacterium]MDD3851341.1 FMN-binding protein [Bacillota bacterium]MDD4706931.1 FMN-binding protein [Bacillota bacterium]
MMKNPIARLIIVLALISIGSGLFLALTYTYTIPHIEANAAHDQEVAILETLPDAVSFEELKNTEFPIYVGLDSSGNEVGFAYVAEGGGFQGMIGLMVGVDPEQEIITGVKILSHSETPGLGARITEAVFLDQFAQKSISDNFIVKEDIDGVTGATFSSKSVSAILEQTLPKAVEQYRESGGGK